jgi:hypothetical protein
LSATYRTAASFCVVQSPLQGIYIEIADNDTNCFGGRVDTLDPSLSYAFGPGLTNAVAGEPATFTIQATNVQGNPRSSGGDIFTVVITPIGGGASISGAVVDNGTSAYAVWYTAPTLSGLYTIQITSENVSIINSPFTLVVGPGM